MGQTSKYKIPYPDVNDIANIPGDLQKIAEKTEAIIQKHVMTNENAEDLISKVEQLQTENNELKAQIPERQCRRQQRTYRRQFKHGNAMETEGWT